MTLINQNIIFLFASFAVLIFEMTYGRFNNSAIISAITSTLACSYTMYNIYIFRCKDPIIYIPKNKKWLNQYSIEAQDYMVDPFMVCYFKPFKFCRVCKELFCQNYYIQTNKKNQKKRVKVSIFKHVVIYIICLSQTLVIGLGVPIQVIGAKALLVPNMCLISLMFFTP